MKWFRSNIRLGSRIALFALALQFALSFGHFHGGAAEASPMQLNHSGVHDAADFAVARRVLHQGLHARTAVPLRVRTSPRHEPADQPADECAICAVMALAGAILVAAPPCLSVPRAVVLLCCSTETDLFHVNPVGVAFQPRGPPIA